jgi:putative glutamine amidotransferase
VTEAAAIQYTYLESLWRSGCDEAMVAPRSLTASDARAYLSRVDGLVIVGGGDVDPALFGQERHEKVYDVEPNSDALELALAKAAFEMGKPFLAICRGMQVLNVALGGTLHQHITREPGFGEHGDPSEGKALHSVNVDPGTALSKAIGGASTIESCWSFHHQAIDILGAGLIVSARSDDGAVEGIERADSGGGWLVGVQWHPERTSHQDPNQQSLFNELAAHAAH